MKTPILLVAALLGISMFTQAQTISPAPEGKAVVYIARTSSLGFAINFAYFDSTTLIGKFNGPKYIRYECDPGKHLFWAKSENFDFISADLEAGKIYFILATPKMGAVKAAVKIEPVDPKNLDAMTKIKKLMGKKTPVTFTAAELSEETKEQAETIKEGLRKAEEDRQKGDKTQTMTADMNHML